MILDEISSVSISEWIPDLKRRQKWLESAEARYSWKEAIYFSWISAERLTATMKAVELSRRESLEKGDKLCPM